MYSVPCHRIYRYVLYKYWFDNPATSIRFPTWIDVEDQNDSNMHNWESNRVA